MTRAATAAQPRAAWTFASGLVSALDTRLLSQRATLELLQADGLDDLLARVRQTLLFADVPEAREPFELAEGMQAAYAAGVRRIGEASPTPAVADLFLLPIEWQAFRGFLREKALGLERAAAPGSAVPDAAWEQCWAAPGAEPPLDLFAEAAAALRQAAPRDERSPQLLDAITHLYETRDVRRRAREAGSPLIAEWVHTWQRLRLGLALLRCRFNRWENILGAEAAADLGLAEHEVAALLAEERRDWRPFLAGLGLPAAQSLPDEEPLAAAAAVERLIDDAVTDLSRAGRSEAFGPEPVFTFLWGLRCEAINLQTIAAGVAAGLSRDSLAGGLRQTYV